MGRARQSRTAWLATVGAVAMVMGVLTACGSTATGTAVAGDEVTTEQIAAPTEEADGSEEAAEAGESTEDAPEETTAPTTDFAPGAPSPQESATDEPEPTQSAESTEPTEPESTTEEPGVDPHDPACLIGDWVVEAKAIKNFYDSLDTGVAFTVKGKAGLTITAKKYEWKPKYTVLFDFGGLEATGKIDGTVGGNYQAADGIITTSREHSKAKLTVSVLGRTIDGADIFDDLMAMYSLNQTPYTCTDAGPVLTFLPSESNPVPMPLVAR